MSFFLSVVTALLGYLYDAETCSSTIFGQPGDKWVGGKAITLKRRVNNRDQGIAHRSLPLRSKVLVLNLEKGKYTVASVIDRGPYGALHNGKWLIKKHARSPGTWRGCVDLTPATARAIGHNGRQYVTVIPLGGAQQPTR